MSSKLSADLATLKEMGATPALIKEFLAATAAGAPSADELLGKNRVSAEGFAIMEEFRAKTYAAINIVNPVDGGKTQPASFVLRQMAEGASDVPEIANTLEAAADAIDRSLAIAHNILLDTIHATEVAFKVVGELGNKDAA
jgi:hypothetical protein